jgi:hypothetical protein
MSPRLHFQTEILDKLAAPLMAAIIHVEKLQKDPPLADQAEILSRLLGKSVQLGIALSVVMNVRGQDDDSEAVRVALACAAAPVVASFYQESGAAPEESDIKRIAKTMTAALSFADNLSPAADTIARIENIKPGIMLLDSAQVNIRYLTAISPVASAVCAFPFGRTDTALIQEITGYIVRKAQVLAESVAPSAPENIISKTALEIVSAFAELYAQCYRKETQKAAATSPSERAALADGGDHEARLEAIRDAFDARAALLFGLAGAVAPVRRQPEAQEQEAQEQEAQTQETHAQQERPQEQEQTQQPQAPAPELPPMPPAPPPPPPPQPPLQNLTSPVVQESVSQIEGNPQEAIEEEAYEEGAGEEETGEEEAGDFNPMSFFTPAPKDDKAE